MGINPWPGDAVSVVLLPSSEVGSIILDRARSWSKAGLLAPCIWVSPEQSNAQSPSNFEVFGHVYAQYEQKEIDVFEQLALENYKRIRLIALRTLFVPGQDLEASKQHDATQLAALSKLEESIMKALPTNPTSLPHENLAKVSKINAIVSPHWVKTVEDRSLIQPMWDWNLVLALENRLSPFTLDKGLRQNEEYFGALLANLATLAGLWSGVPKSSLELLPQEPSSSHKKLWVHRTFVRGVVKQGVVSGVTAEVLQLAGDPDFDLYDSIEGIVPDDVQPVSPEKTSIFIDTLVAETMKLDKGVLQYQRPPDFVLPEKFKIGAFRQFVDFLSFSWDKLKLLPLLIFRALADAFNRLMNRVFQGKDGASVVDVKEDIKPLKNDKRDVKLFADMSFLEESIRNHKDQLNLRKPPVVDEIPPNSNIWRGFRQIVFAALDGSAPPEGTSLPVNKNNQTPVVLRRVSDVFFNPEDKWSAVEEFSELTGIHEVAWNDLNLASTRRSEVSIQIYKVSERITSLRKVLDMESTKNER